MTSSSTHSDIKNLFGGTSPSSSMDIFVADSVSDSEKQSTVLYSADLLDLGKSESVVASPDSSTKNNNIPVTDLEINSSGFFCNSNTSNDIFSVSEASVSQSSNLLDVFDTIPLESSITTKLESNSASSNLPVMENESKSNTVLLDFSLDDQPLESNNMSSLILVENSSTNFCSSNDQSDQTTGLSQKVGNNFLDDLLLVSFDEQPLNDEFKGLVMNKEAAKPIENVITDTNERFLISSSDILASSQSPVACAPDFISYGLSSSESVITTTAENVKTSERQIDLEKSNCTDINDIPNSNNFTFNQDAPFKQDEANIAVALPQISFLESIDLVSIVDPISTSDQKSDDVLVAEVTSVLQEILSKVETEKESEENFQLFSSFNDKLKKMPLNVSSPFDLAEENKKGSVLELLFVENSNFNQNTENTICASDENSGDLMGSFDQCYSNTDKLPEILSSDILSTTNATLTLSDSVTETEKNTALVASKEIISHFNSSVDNINIESTRSENDFSEFSNSCISYADNDELKVNGVDFENISLAQPEQIGDDFASFTNLHANADDFLETECIHSNLNIGQVSNLLDLENSALSEQDETTTYESNQETKTNFETLIASTQKTETKDLSEITSTTPKAAMQLLDLKEKFSCGSLETTDDTLLVSANLFSDAGAFFENKKDALIDSSMEKKVDHNLDISNDNQSTLLSGFSDEVSNVPSVMSNTLLTITEENQSCLFDNSFKENSQIDASDLSDTSKTGVNLFKTASEVTKSTNIMLSFETTMPDKMSDPNQDEDSEGSMYESDDINISDSSSNSQNEFESSDVISEVSSLEFDDNPFSVSSSLHKTFPGKLMHEEKRQQWSQNLSSSSNPIPTSVFVSDDWNSDDEVSLKEDQSFKTDYKLFMQKLQLSSLSDETEDVDIAEPMAFDSNWDEIQFYKPKIDILPMILEVSEPEDATDSETTTSASLECFENASDVSSNSFSETNSSAIIDNKNVVEVETEEEVLFEVEKLLEHILNKVSNVDQVCALPVCISTPDINKSEEETINKPDAYGDFLNDVDFISEVNDVSDSVQNTMNSSQLSSALVDNSTTGFEDNLLQSSDHNISAPFCQEIILNAKVPLIDPTIINVDLEKPCAKFVKEKDVEEESILCFEPPNISDSAQTEIINFNKSFDCVESTADFVIPLNSYTTVSTSTNSTVSELEDKPIALQEQANLTTFEPNLSEQIFASNVEYSCVNSNETNSFIITNKSDITPSSILVLKNDIKSLENKNLNECTVKQEDEINVSNISKENFMFETLGEENVELDTTTTEVASHTIQDIDELSNSDLNQKEFESQTSQEPDLNAIQNKPFDSSLQALNELNILSDVASVDNNTVEVLETSNDNVSDVTNEVQNAVSETLVGNDGFDNIEILNLGSKNLNNETGSETTPESSFPMVVDENCIENLKIVQSNSDDELETDVDSLLKISGSPKPREGLPIELPSVVLSSSPENCDKEAVNSQTEEILLGTNVVSVEQESLLDSFETEVVDDPVSKEYIGSFDVPENESNIAMKSEMDTTTTEVASHTIQDIDELSNFNLNQKEFESQTSQEPDLNAIQNKPFDSSSQAHKELNILSDVASVDNNTVEVLETSNDNVSDVTNEVQNAVSETLVGNDGFDSIDILDLASTNLKEQTGSETTPESSLSMLVDENSENELETDVDSVLISSGSPKPPEDLPIELPSVVLSSSPGDCDKEAVDSQTEEILLGTNVVSVEQESLLDSFETEVVDDPVSKEYIGSFDVPENESNIAMKSEMDTTTTEVASHTIQDIDELSNFNLNQKEFESQTSQEPDLNAIQNKPFDSSSQAHKELNILSDVASVDNNTVEVLETSNDNVSDVTNEVQNAVSETLVGNDGFDSIDILDLASTNLKEQTGSETTPESSLSMLVDENSENELETDVDSVLISSGSPKPPEDLPIELPSVVLSSSPGDCDKEAVDSQTEEILLGTNVVSVEQESLLDSFETEVVDDPVSKEYIGSFDVPENESNIAMKSEMDTTTTEVASHTIQDIDELSNFNLNQKEFESQTSQEPDLNAIQNKPFDSSSQAHKELNILSDVASVDNNTVEVLETSNDNVSDVTNEVQNAVSETLVGNDGFDRIDVLDLGSKNLNDQTIFETTPESSLSMVVDENCIENLKVVQSNTEDELETDVNSVLISYGSSKPPEDLPVDLTSVALSSVPRVGNIEAVDSQTKEILSGTNIVSVEQESLLDCCETDLADDPASKECIGSFDVPEIHGNITTEFGLISNEDADLVIETIENGVLETTQVFAGNLVEMVLSKVFFKLQSVENIPLAIKDFTSESEIIFPGNDYVVKNVSQSEILQVSKQEVASDNKSLLDFSDNNLYFMEPVANGQTSSVSENSAGRLELNSTDLTQKDEKNKVVNVDASNLEKLFDSPETELLLSVPTNSLVNDDIVSEGYNCADTVTKNSPNHDKSAALVVDLPANETDCKETSIITLDFNITENKPPDDVSSENLSSLCLNSNLSKLQVTDHDINASNILNNLYQVSTVDQSDEDHISYPSDTQVLNNLEILEEQSLHDSYHEKDDADAKISSTIADIKITNATCGVNEDKENTRQNIDTFQNLSDFSSKPLSDKQQDAEFIETSTFQEEIKDLPSTFESPDLSSKEHEVIQTISSNTEDPSDSADEDMQVESATVEQDHESSMPAVHALKVKPVLQDDMLLNKKKLSLDINLDVETEDFSDEQPRKVERQRYDTTGTIDFSDFEEDLDATSPSIFSNTPDTDEPQSTNPGNDYPPLQTKRKSLVPPSSLLKSVALNKVETQTPAITPVSDIVSADDIFEANQSHEVIESEGLHAASGKTSTEYQPKLTSSPPVTAPAIPHLVPPSNVSNVCWEKITINNVEYQIDGSVIQPYKKVISHGGFYKEKNTIVEIFGHYLPDSSVSNYVWVIDNLFLFLLSTIELLVQDRDYVIVFLNNSVSKSQFPSTAWLKKSHSYLPKYLRKNIKGFYVVQPSFYMKTIINFSRMFLNRKAFKKIKHVKSHVELKQYIPIDFLFVPEDILKQYQLSIKAPAREVKSKWSWW